jgi:hypothetical protein
MSRPGLRAVWRLALSIACLVSMAASAQVLTATDRGIVLAHDHRIELAGAWKIEGVAHATAVIAGDERVVVLDALNNEAVVAELATGRATRIRTAETPIDAAFVGDELYILARDARLLQHIGGKDVALQADFLEAENGKLYAYSRVTGALHRVGGATIQVAPFASDFEIDGGTAYLTFPREARVRTADLETGKVAEVAVGAVPVDLAFAGGGTAISARILAVADPSAKRVWMAESTQSMAAAVTRGFLRGFLGLGLFGHRDSRFPTGVDRVETRGKTWIAYDSSSRTLYHFTRSETSVIARNVAPLAFALTGNGVAWWNGTSVAEKRLR